MVSGRALYCRCTCLPYVDDITNCLSFGQKPLIIMYADDIILVASSECVLTRRKTVRNIIYDKQVRRQYRALPDTIIRFL